jgi:DNA invertase Pin-like site-specific DNA recombinase
MRVGYARVSTTEQNLSLQIGALEEAGCDKIFTDKVSGKAFERPGLQAAFDYMREGDSLVIWRLDRLGRSLAKLIEVSQDLETKKIHLVSLKDAVDTNTAAGRFYFHIIGALAEMERDLNQERTLAGLEAARQQGRVGGRPSVLDAQKKAGAKHLIESGMSMSEISKIIGTSVATLYRHFPASRRG